MTRRPRQTERQRVRSVAASVVLGVMATAAMAGEWSEHAPLPAPVSNNAVTAHVLADTPYVYTFMGIDSTKVGATGIVKTAARLNTISNVWEMLPDVPSVNGRIAASAVTVGDSLYVIGGYRLDQFGSEVTSPRMMIFDALLGDWVGFAADVPQRVDDAVAATWRGTHIFVVSGWSQNTNVTNVQVWERATGVWSQATPIPGYGTFGGVGGICGDAIVFMDGVADTAGFDQTNRVLVGMINPADPTDVAWEDRGPHPGAPTYRAAAWNPPADASRIIIAGGTDNPYNIDGIGYNGVPSEPLGQVWSYEPGTGQFTFFDDNPLPTMDHRGFPAAGERMVLIGGMEAGQTVTARVSSWSVDPATGLPPYLPVPAAVSFDLGPNPTRGPLRFSLHSGDERIVDFAVYDLRGRRVRTLGTDLPAVWSGGWDLEDSNGRPVSAGVYFLRARLQRSVVARSVHVLDR